MVNAMLTISSCQTTTAIDIATLVGLHPESHRTTLQDLSRVTQTEL